jgi:hypothetical protein
MTVRRRATLSRYHLMERTSMATVSDEPDEFLEQVLEDERAAALQEFREREESST